MFLNIIVSRPGLVKKHSSSECTAATPSLPKLCQKGHQSPSSGYTEDCKGTKEVVIGKPVATVKPSVVDKQVRFYREHIIYSHFKTNTQTLKVDIILEMSMFSMV